MGAALDIETFEDKVSVLKPKIISHVNEVTEAMETFFGRTPKYVIFISISDIKERARVFVGIGNSAESSWQNAMIACRKEIKNNRWQPVWVKVDLVKEIKTYTLEEFLEYSTKTRKNYLREGLSLDPFFHTAFLEQEWNANGFIKREDSKPKDELHLSNINFYLKTYRSLKNPIQAEHIQQVYLFSTYSYFYDTECHELHSGPLHNGRRKIDHIDKETVYQLIDHSSTYLANQVGPNGKFIYGYFPSFNRQIRFYNMLRHASTTYSMIEAYEVTRNDQLASHIQRACDYLIKEGIEFVQGRGTETLAYVVERESGNEIKLGANAAAILALSKFTSVFQTSQFRGVMTALANGIVAMQDPDSGGFVHVLNFPDLSVKDKFRIVYYDGEAAFALMRLYAIDQNPKWLHTVEKAFAYFIKNDYWKYHDHWLSYCTNELTEYRPLKEYFEFGIKNVEKKLDFILHRDTTYPTFLELLMASYKMIRKMKSLGMEDLLEEFDHDKLMAAIEGRVRHQLNGYFFPEVAMYFKNPQTIAGSFYIRHHSFRCRIDDVEHNISGYYNYYNEFM
ncbi:hypothetical protein [Paenibacillus sp. J2TS4]|uniref:hypothetical protein n=1 Tax=Paenibacillus sp. J2TS4 TaxID=2807194 RepID=UPI001B217018|nr:hypothetical protein [Paenibacillus sp. J2TS4]GIP35229.1 hypothetical protein J2TS4_44390 [Paenibacillus sp. J2TS4]